jgi:toxin ParE1/3/4
MSARRLRIIYTQEARTDLRDIQIYTEQQWGRTQRAAYIHMLREAVRRLATLPGLGRPREEIWPGLRSFMVGSHVIYYFERNSGLIIAHIFHERRDSSSVRWSEDLP